MQLEKFNSVFDRLKATFILLLIDYCSQNRRVSADNSTQTLNNDNYGTINVKTGVNTNATILIVLIVVTISIVIIVISTICFKLSKKTGRYLAYTVENPKDDKGNTQEIEVATIASNFI
jgi:hypothetical protein